MNAVVVLGRVVRDLDVRYTSGDNPMCIARYTLAVDRRYKKEGQPTADFLNCVALAKNGEFAEKYFHKGMKIAIMGSIQTGSYTNREGQKVYTTEILVDRQEFADGKPTSQPEQSQPQSKPQDFMDIPDGMDSELPFH